MGGRKAQTMTFILLLFVTITCGAYAQTAKGRTGALWGVITFILGLIWWGFLSAVTSLQAHVFAGIDETAMSFAMALVVNVPLWLLMAVIVATLPKRGHASRDTPR
jgi:hypothetical protein